MSETLMLELGKTLGRQRAHDIVYEVAQMAAGGSRPFRDLLAEDVEISSRLSADEIDRILDPMTHIGLCREMAHEQAEVARSTAAVIRAGGA
jgi:3-carboxy-cis,cis-muconate cycloisomerase